ncbi:UNVERIFIED_CONTAM: ESX-1 secretion system protein EccA1 [Sesamum angustifolium]|uniref:ESX-1 secretion system protein EccA1 n=1 Tax=Sesamum angustifolium TaxID=2727405 RepID=A0AAW2N7E8_9LAMI
MQKVKDQRARSLKPTTIHGFAQCGDFSAFQKLLRGNPSLLNERNPVMAQTPLHVSAGYNSIEIVKFLLDWQGPEKVELEAKNMYGETPLHMAAKNGCNEAAKLLLGHGAVVESKANNGMTPLHLAVWHSLRAEDFSTVNTLLEYNADCSAEDNEGMTPLNHLSQGPGNEKLRDLLLRHLAEQRKRRAIEACSETKAKMDALENELSHIVGLHALKLQLRKWQRACSWMKGAVLLGLELELEDHHIWPFLEILEQGNRSSENRSGWRVCWSYRAKDQKKDPRSRGGILFIDEAYRLIPMQKSDDKDYGLEALEEIMSVMDSGKVVVVFAGYSEPMSRVISSNEGFCRRVTKFFHFDDFSSMDLAKILHIKMSNQAEDSLLHGFKLHTSCTVEAVAALIERETTEKQRKEMNGGIVDPMLVNARENLDLRTDFECVDPDSLLTITLEDLEAGLRLLTH